MTRNNFYLGIILLLAAVSAFSQPIRVTPPVIDLGEVPVGYSTYPAYIIGGVYAITNISQSAVIISPPYVFSKDTAHPVTDLFQQSIPLALYPGQTWYGAVNYTSRDTGTGHDMYVRIWYSTGYDINNDSMDIPIHVHGFQPSTPFLSSFHVGSQLISACDTSVYNSPPYSGEFHWGIDMFNPTNKLLLVDSIALSGDFDTTGFYIHALTKGFSMPGNSVTSAAYVLFESSIIGYQQLHFKVYYRYYNYPDTGTHTEYIMDSVITGYTMPLPNYVVEGNYISPWGNGEQFRITPAVSVNNCYDSSSSADIKYWGAIGHCMDSATFHLDFVGARSNAFSLYQTPSTFTLQPDGGEQLVHIQFCPLVPGYSTTDGDTDGYVNDSLRIICDYNDGTHDTTFLQIASRTPVVTSVHELFPVHPSLVQSYPNPFTTSTQIVLPQTDMNAQRVSITDMLGKEVALFPKESYNNIMWTPDASVPAGTYFLVVKSPTGITSKPIVLLR